MRTGLRNEEFDFGANWESFRPKISEDRVDAAVHALQERLAPLSCTGGTFVDVGCGSGINSLAAYRIGFDRVLSFDLARGSVRATLELKSDYGGDDRWQAICGSILDPSFVKRLGQFDVVYAWGVLHHTGDVWRAIDLVTHLVAPSGSLILATYSADVIDAPQREMWLDKKRSYNRSSRIGKRFMELDYFWTYTADKSLRRAATGLREARRARYRGMDYWVDVRDWLGGLPMEWVYDRDVELELEARSFDVVEIKAGEACTEFSARRRLSNL